MIDTHSLSGVKPNVRMNCLTPFRVICLFSEYSPVQSESRTATVLSYDPSNQNVQLEYVKDAFRDIQDTFSETLLSIFPV